MLFSGKKAVDSPWQIWEMNVDGSGVRQVTHCAGDCLKPAYLPRGEIVYTALPEEPAERKLQRLPWRTCAPLRLTSARCDGRKFSTLGQQTGWL